MTISFDSGRHEQLLAGLTAATEDIEAALTKLEDRVQTLRSGWDGGATAGETMRAAENAARAIWS